ncbi:MAG: glutamate--tRNA ligase, partial [Opitutaceae bacterium]
HRKRTVIKVKNEPAVIDDLIRGRVERIEDEDFVIVRSDGSPVFHLVNVVDDLTMKITHVIRGEDHLSNTSKHVELFKAFGAQAPAYAHIPLILKQSGPGKMSKRDQGALVEEYRNRGYLSEALVNFLCLLGWNPGGDREKMTLDEIVRRFDLPGVNQSHARFDDKKLAHMNMLYLLELPADRFAELARDYYRRRNAFERGWPDEAYFRAVMALCHPKIRAIEELPAYAGYFFAEDYPTDPKAREKIMGKGDPRARLRELAEAMAAADFSTDASLEAAVRILAASRGAAIAEYIHPGRLAVSGTSVGPSFYGLLRVLGRERVLRRIERFLIDSAAV